MCKLLWSRRLAGAFSAAELPRNVRQSQACLEEALENAIPTEAKDTISSNKMYSDNNVTHTGVFSTAS